jgi:putative ATPase
MSQASKPLAERMRPRSLEGYAGQKHLVGHGQILQRAIAKGALPSMIFWGPPGVGKTTLAHIISQQLERPFYTLSAVSSGVKDVREVIARAQSSRYFDSAPPVLFIDEIHRFSKSQQDSLLAAVEQGQVVLIGATTENPSFEVISPLLSRCQVYVLKPLEKEDLRELLHRAIADDEVLNKIDIRIEEDEALFRFSGGDARKLLNVLEIVASSGQPGESLVLTNELVQSRLQENIALYDKNGEMHYDIISAFIKSIRGSDPNAAVYWLARMLDAGEDIKFIARRLVISAAEDIGLANPNALLMANSAFQAVSMVGMPESRIILSEATIYLAASPKSNSAYTAINHAMQVAKDTAFEPVPLNLRNAPTKLMEKLGYGKGYKYSHDYEGSFVKQDFMPGKLKGEIFYRPKANAKEREMLKALQAQWGGIYNYGESAEGQKNN